MPHLFEGDPDARQSADPGEPAANAPRFGEVSRFRPRCRALTGAEKSLHDAVKQKAAELEALFDQVKPGRYNALAMTSLEAAVLWCIKGLTS